MEKIEFLPFVIIMLFSAAIFGMFLMHKFYSILKKKHNEKWQELGSPSLIKNNSFKTCFATGKVAAPKPSTSSIVITKTISGFSYGAKAETHAL